VLLLVAISLEPFVGFAAANRGQLGHPGRLVSYALVSTLVVLGCFALARRLGRDSDPDATAMAVGVVFVSFLHYSLVFNSNPADGGLLVSSLLVWLILTLALARVAFLVGGNATVRFAVGIFVIAAVLVQVVSFVQAPQRADRVLESAERAVPPRGRHLPNVYFYVLDSHARPDVMREVTGHDLTPFVGSLEGDGFEVSNSSRTSYPRTILSLASTFDMRYVLQPGHAVEDDYADFAPVIVGGSETVRRLRALGYHTGYGEPGGLEWPRCREEMVDVCFKLHRPWPSTGELEESLLDLMPLGVIDLPVPYSDPMTMANGTLEMLQRGQEPFFAYTHVLAPHFPHRYRDDCSARRVPLPRDARTRETVVHDYVTQVRCVDALIQEAVDAIVERDPSAIVIIQSDHGSDIDFTWSAPPEEWTPDQVRERYAAFHAIRLPSQCQGPVDHSAIVNTFRIVLACLEGREPQLLEYRAFGQPLNDVTGLVELTPDQIRD
jgi:hypothetical protein